MTIQTKNIIDDTIPNDIDFSHGIRGKFYQPDMQINLPVYLDENIQRKLVNIAMSKGVELSALVNELLQKDIELIEVLT